MQTYTETVGRYRVMRRENFDALPAGHKQHWIESEREIPWGLLYSTACEDDAKAVLSDEAECWGRVYEFKIVDAGGPSTVQRLNW